MIYKKLLYCLVAFSFLVSGCSSDDTPDPTPGYDPNEKLITSFEVEKLSLTGTIDQSSKTITLLAPAKVEITQLAPAISVSQGASVQPASMVQLDFSSDVTYMVTAEDGTSQNYTVSASVLTDTALVIIDMQNAAFNSPVFHFLNATELTERLIDLAPRARYAGKRVVYCQATSEGNPQGSVGWQPVPGLEFEDQDIIVLKYNSDSFLGTELQNELDAIGVGCIVICGVATDQCIQKTFGGANKRQYDIIMVGDGHSAVGDDYEEIIDEYNQTWETLGANVLSCSEITFW